MPITTIKRFQSDRNWHWTLENCNIEVADEPLTGLTLKYFDSDKKEGHQIFTMSREDALLMRGALNEMDL